MNKRQPLAGKTVLVAMSGGVDSSVAAALLKKQGANVIGITLSVWPEDSMACARSCCSVTDVDDARAVCSVLQIPHYVLDMQDAFQHEVIDYFTSEYLRGRTPNPCIACNEHIKFAAMFRKADELRADYIATGHYAHVMHRPEGFRLTRAVDTHKDQTYVLYMFGQKELQRILFPCADYEKPQIRALAKEFGLPTFQKPDSQDLCFIGQQGYAAFLRENCAGLTRPGEIINEAGKVIGHHEGVYLFTVGQHKGLGAFSEEKLYVTAIDAEHAIVHVGKSDALFSTGALLENLSETFDNALCDGTSIEVKIRYSAPAVPALFTHTKEGPAVVFNRPQRAVTPGQAAVFYQNDTVLGGGTIQKALKKRPL